MYKSYSIGPSKLNIYPDNPRCGKFLYGWKMPNCRARVAFFAADVKCASFAHENGICGIILGADVKFSSLAVENGICGVRTSAIPGGQNGWIIFGGGAPVGERRSPLSAITPRSPDRPAKPNWRTQPRLSPSLTY